MSSFMGIVARGVHAFLRSRYRPSQAGGATCAVCGRSTGVVTSCCKVPLCGHHLEMWKADPSPCACHR